MLLHQERYYHQEILQKHSPDRKRQSLNLIDSAQNRVPSTKGARNTTAKYDPFSNYLEGLHGLHVYSDGGDNCGRLAAKRGLKKKTLPKSP